MISAIAPMYLTHVHHRVEDYDRWKKAFDSNAPLLDEAGALDTHIVQVNGDPCDVVIINTWPSKQNWDDFLALDADRHKNDQVDLRKTGGVIGEPQFYGGEVMGEFEANPLVPHVA
jgi:heme-degrading monooxygenase HmoA